jgi:3-oxoacyl-[acyl-carrier protein] reductase
MVNGRSAGTPERTAAEIRRETGGALIAVVADVATLKGQQTLLAAVPTVNIPVNNNGAPPRRSFRKIDRRALLTGLVGNMTTPIELVR